MDELNNGWDNKMKVKEQDIKYQVERSFSPCEERFVHTLYCKNHGKTYGIEKLLPEGESLTQLDKMPMVAALLARANELEMD